MRSAYTLSDVRDTSIAGVLVPLAALTRKVGPCLAQDRPKLLSSGTLEVLWSLEIDPHVAVGPAIHARTQGEPVREFGVSAEELEP